MDDLEDKKDDATIRCVVDSNPQSKVTWRKEKAGDAVISNESEIIFSPVSRLTAGLYSCVAENPLGMSKPAFVELDVKCKLKHITFCFTKKEKTLYYILTEQCLL